MLRRVLFLFLVTQCLTSFVHVWKITLLLWVRSPWALWVLMCWSLLSPCVWQGLSLAVHSQRLPRATHSCHYLLSAVPSSDFPKNWLCVIMVPRTLQSLPNLALQQTSELGRLLPSFIKEKTMVHKRQIISRSHAGFSSQPFAADPGALLWACALQSSLPGDV